MLSFIQKAKDSVDLKLNRPVEFDSTAIQRIRYNRRTKELRVVFKTSDTEYLYENVSPSEVKALRLSPSKGRYMSKMIISEHKVKKV